MDTKYQALARERGAGEVESIIYSHIVVVWLGKLFWIAWGVWALWHGRQESIWFHAIVDYLLLAFALWRLLYQGRPRAIICKEGFILRRHPIDLRETLLSFGQGEELLIFVPYERMIGFSEGWEELHLTDLAGSGILVLPLDLQFVSYEDKMRLYRRLEKEKSEHTLQL